MVGFRGQDDAQGNPTWDIYLSEPGERPQERQSSRPSASAAAARDQRRQEREHQAAMALQARHAELDDPVPY
ncbi:hypothetical protein [Geminicoccus flavidas]|uniref:hypothetical protein n=1 Tax=Geminicoccus flavidas TaxID=2506407 RepID=UPI00135BED92|nr:hypothetical protein [Geminicoccus flavidas]